MQKQINTLTLTTATALTIALAEIDPASAITFNFDWNGNASYSARGSFSYDENTAPATFSENGFGATQALQSLDVSFFDPSNNLIATYNNVANGISTGNYFKFNFNTVTKEIFGLIDVGGEFPGETYLKGTVNTNLSLFQVPQAGSDIIIDSNPGSIVAQAVPESNSIWGLLVFGTVGMTFQIKRQLKM